jgi:hypothetical protein
MHGLGEAIKVIIVHFDLSKKLRPNKIQNPKTAGLSALCVVRWSAKTRKRRIQLSFPATSLRVSRLGPEVCTPFILMSLSFYFEHNQSKED